MDHGVFRLIYLNRQRLGKMAWRSAQPAPHNIAQFKRLGVKTIVNLRGERMSGGYWLEVAACKKHGIKLVDCVVRSRAAPSVEELRSARDVFQNVEYPMLMHCKSGADRAGLMSVLYMHLVERQPIEQAVEQLSLRYGHIKQADTGVLDHFFARYIEANRQSPIDFFEWVETDYDPDEVLNSFRANGLASRIVNHILRRE
jgi:protein tyrosine/serine phosphatase